MILPAAFIITLFQMEHVSTMACFADYANLSYSFSTVPRKCICKYNTRKEIIAGNERIGPVLKICAHLCIGRMEADNKIELPPSIDTKSYRQLGELEVGVRLCLLGHYQVAVGIIFLTVFRHNHINDFIYL